MNGFPHQAALNARSGGPSTSMDVYSSYDQASKSKGSTPFFR